METKLFFTVSIYSDLPFPGIANRLRQGSQLTIWSHKFVASKIK
jgi:hypothetical protein